MAGAPGTPLRGHQVPAEHMQLDTHTEGAARVCGSRGRGHTCAGVRATGPCWPLSLPMLLWGWGFPGEQRCPHAAGVSPWRCRPLTERC